MARIPENLHPVVEFEGVPHYQAPMEEVRGLAWALGDAVMRSSFEVEHLVAITRGGLSVADCVSRSMDLRDIQTLAVELYEPNPDPEGPPEIPLDKIRVYREPKLRRYGRGALFVDDVLDNGHTAGYVRDKWPQAAMAVAYTKHLHEETLNKVDFYGRYVGNIWIDFPWEVEAQARRELRKPPNRVLF